MMKDKITSRGLAAGAVLALVAAISIGLATNTKADATNTSSSLKTKVAVLAPSEEDIVKASQTQRLNTAMQVLSPRDAALYRTAFEAQAHGDWAKANRALFAVSDTRLVGSVMADRFERRGATGDQLVAWLNVFAAQPEAEAFYTMAKKEGVKNPPKPQVSETWGSGAEAESVANFSPDLMVESTAKNSKANQWARKIRSALRRHRPSQARNHLLEAQKRKQLAGTFAADAEAVIAEAFFREGERKEALALANAAARANQPLGLWICGLMAWESQDYKTAQTMFDRLSQHPALTPNNKAAAHFWTYRAEKQLGNTGKGTAHLRKAAASPWSFYGLLATQLLGQDPSQMLKPETLPKWSEKHRKTLASTPAGWRALALIQVGETPRAEKELRRLTPLGSRSKRRAMLALADFVPMPALALRLASLSNTEGLALTAYPLLPWQPTGGYIIDRALLFALARHESMFDPSAVSSRGARGLMQIMPATADDILSSDSLLSGLAGDRELADPDFNMALGQKYVQHLTERPQIGDNLVLILAAYNAGPTKASSWFKDKGEMDPLLFMESIPVQETRNYVAKVLPHYWAYRVRLGHPTTALRTLAQGQWPRVPLDEAASLRMASAN